MELKLAIQKQRSSDCIAMQFLCILCANVLALTYREIWLVATIWYNFHKVNKKKCLDFEADLQKAFDCELVNNIFLLTLSSWWDLLSVHTQNEIRYSHDSPVFFSAQRTKNSNQSIFRYVENGNVSNSNYPDLGWEMREK